MILNTLLHSTGDLRQPTGFEKIGTSSKPLRIAINIKTVVRKRGCSNPGGIQSGNHL
jgi:hypothetical protein